MTTTKNILKPGDTLHFFSTVAIVEDPYGFTSPKLMVYGSELQLTQKILDFYEYPEKPSWLTRVDQPDRHGVVRVASGPWPKGELRTQPGSIARDEQRAAARATAYGEKDPLKLAQKLAEIDRVYGAWKGSTNSITYSRRTRQQEEDSF